jgi:hypothetical protein
MRWVFLAPDIIRLHKIGKEKIMSASITFPYLAGWESTKNTLHLYAQAIGVVPRTHATFHPKWWHVSLKVQSDGLITDDMSLPEGGTFNLRMDLREHQVVLTTSLGTQRSFSMREGLTSTTFGDQIVAAVTGLGLEGEYARERYQNEEAREYDPIVAEEFFTALTNADRIFKKHRSTLKGEVGPVQLWPHGFDLSFEWYGTRMITYEEHGEVKEFPSQLNLGLSPGDSEQKPYFYSNPWPFETEQLMGKPLPAGARWFIDSWQGSILPYAELAGERDAEARLLAYAKAVYDISRPTLMA